MEKHSSHGSHTKIEKLSQTVQALSTDPTQSAASSAVPAIAQYAATTVDVFHQSAAPPIKPTTEHPGHQEQAGQHADVAFASALTASASTNNVITAAFSTDNAPANPDVSPHATFTTDGSTIQTYTISTSGTYDITVDGAQGGESVGRDVAGGKGATVSGDIYLAAGTVLDIVVGVEGGAAGFFDGGGGGGGSFVFATNGQGGLGQLLEAAGGGGGAGGATTAGGGAGQTDGNGSHGGGLGSGSGGTSGAAGTGGAYGGGGGGYTGGTGSDYAFRGASGATAETSFDGGAAAPGGPDGTPGAGGFGGGGGGGTSGGGGGGGYGGGGGGGHFSESGGGGGGSYLLSGFSNISETVGANSGNGLVSITPACYVSGTCILTTNGEVPIESLNINDHVITASGAMRPIKWIGHRAYIPHFANANPHLLPITFKAGSLGNDLPRRDLHVSPKHAMFIDNALIPAENLVNKSTILKTTRIDTPLTYWHIELETHDVILAEGAPSETFVDDNNRGIFHNAHQFWATHSNDIGRPAIYCAPRLDHGFELAAIRARLAEIAGISRPQDYGPLSGSFTITNGAISGWARNDFYPGAQVCLDIFVNNALIAQTFANLPHPEAGRHAFKVNLLPEDNGKSVQVRRSLDGAPLQPATSLPTAA